MTSDGSVVSHSTGPTSEGELWGEIDGVPITLPVVVEEMRSATLTFTVPIEPARALLPGDAFEVAEMGPGEAMLVIALVDYVRNPWGDYGEVNLGLLAHPAGEPDRVGAFVWRMPVDQEFTCAAGNQVMGLPKTVEDIAVDDTEHHVTFTLTMGGAMALRVRLPRAEPVGEPTAETTVTWSYLDGVPTAVPLTIELATGIVGGDEVDIELGTGVVADELRSLGLPKAPDLAMWGEGLSGTFGRPEPLRRTS
jgi:hypothetical protein